LAIALQNLVLLLFSADYQTIPASPFQTGTWTVGGIALSKPRMLAFVMMLLTSGALFWFLRSSDFGRAIRATAQDRLNAKLMGINVNRVQMVSFGLGSAIVGLTACLVAPIYTVFPSMGNEFALAAFVVVILGGLGSLPGAILGGL